MNISRMEDEPGQLVFRALYGREFTFYGFALLRDARKLFLEFAHREKPFGLLVKVAYSLARPSKLYPWSRCLSPLTRT
jgi:hypothetical protein